MSLAWLLAFRIRVRRLSRGEKIGSARRLSIDRLIESEEEEEKRGGGGPLI
jgi:hypothetical protein